MFALEARQLAREGDCSRAVLTLNIFGTQGVRRGLFSIDVDDRVFRSIRTGDGHGGCQPLGTTGIQCCEWDLGRLIAVAVRGLSVQHQQ